MASNSSLWKEDADGGLFNATAATNMMAEYDPEIEQMKIQLAEMRFVVQIVLVPFITVIGVCGNIITIAVLTRKSMRSSTNFYLTALAFSDMLYLLLFFSLSLQHHPGMNEPHTWVYWHFSRFARWFVDASSATSTWLTVTFTVERYIAVCYPIKKNVFCTPSRAKKVIIAVFLLCYSLTASTPHEWKVMQIYSDTGNDTNYKMSLMPSDLGMNSTYQHVFYWFSAVMFILLPLLLLSIFNSFLINTVNKSTAERSKLSERPRHEKGSSRAQSQEKKITLMLIAVVVLALVCQTPAAIALLYTSFQKIEPNSKDDCVMRFLGNLFNLLTACNAALNFVLYCALSDKFRKIFMATFCKRCAQKASPQHSSAMLDDHARTTSLLATSYRNQPSSRSNNSSQARTAQTTPASQQLLASPANLAPGANGDQSVPLLQK